MPGPPILGAKAPPASSYRQQSAAARYTGPAHPAPVYVPPPSLAPRLTGQAPAHTDITSSGAGYGSAQANAYKRTAAYRQSVAQTFKAQSTAQKAAIISGLLHVGANRSTSPNFPDFHAVRSAWDTLPPSQTMRVASAIPHDISRFVAAGQTLRGTVADVAGQVGNIAIGTAESSAKSAERQLLAQQMKDFKANTAANVIGNAAGDVAHVLSGAAHAGTAAFGAPTQVQRPAPRPSTGPPIVGPPSKALAGLRSGSLSEQRQTSGGGGLPFGLVAPGKALQLAAGLTPGALPSEALKLGRNTAADALNLPGQTIQGVAGLTQQIAAGNWGNAAHMLTDPYVRFFSDPAGTFERNPLDTGLMFSGPEAAVGRGLGAIGRSGALGERAAEAASTVRAPLRLGPDVAEGRSPIMDYRSYSPNVLHKSLQVARENALRKRGLDPNVAMPKPGWMPKPLANALGVGLEARLRRIPNELAAGHVANVREGRGQVTHAVRRERPPKPVRNMVSFIQQGVVRTRSTAKADIEQEIARLKAEQKTMPRTEARASNRRQIRDLSNALQHPEHWDEAFITADALRLASHTADAYSVNAGLLDPHQAERSRLLTYAQAHMGAKYDFKGDLPTDNALAFKAYQQLEHDAAGDVKTATADLAKRSQDEAVVLARAHALRGPARGRADIRSTPLPRAMAERIFKVQRARAAAEDALLNAKRTHLDARAQRVELQGHANEKLGEGFVHPNGDPLHTQQIVDHINEFNKNNPHDPMSMPAHVGHYPAKQASFRFYRSWKAARGTLQGHRRTGEAFRKGDYDHTYDGLIAGAARTNTALTGAAFQDRIVNRLGHGRSEDMMSALERDQLASAREALKDPHLDSRLRASLEGRIARSKFFTPAEAKHYAYASTHDDHGNLIPGATEMVAMTAHGAKTPLDVLRDLQHPSQIAHGHDALELQAIHRAVNEVEGRHDAVRNVVLIPAHSLDQLQRQFARSSDIARFAGHVTQQFKQTVLPYSMHWLTQIPTESVMRSILAGVMDPRNRAAGRQLMKELGKTGEGKYAAREMTGATFFNKHNPDARFNPNPSQLSVNARAAFKPLIWGHKRYSHAIGSLVGHIEHEFRVMGLGKVARKELQEFTGAYQAGIGLQAKNLQLLHDKLTTDPALVAKFGRQVDDIFGKYNKLSPKVRSAVQAAVPFLPWYLNAARYVLWTLPVQHPVATSVLAALRQTMNQDVQDGKQLPLNAFQAEALGKFTPFQVFPPHAGVGDIAELLTGMIVPQASSAYNVLHGQNVFGTSALTSPSGQPKSLSKQTVLPAFETALEAFLPGLRDVRTVLEGGGTPYGTSTLLSPQTKPGTGSGAGAVLDRIFNPLHAFQAAGAPQKGTSLFNAGGSSGGDLFKSSSSSGGGSLFGAPTQGGAEGMRPQQQGGKILGATQYASGAAVNAINAIGQQVGQAPQPTIPGAFTKAPGAEPWKQGQWTPAKEQQMLDARRNTPNAHPQQLSAQQQGQKKMLAKILDPKKGFGFLQSKPEWLQKAQTPPGTSPAMQAVIGLANSITAHHYNYEWGGGHGALGVPAHGTGHGSGPGIGFDCSGAVSAILHAAGVLNTPLVAAQFETFGDPGPGTKPNDITIYASGGHVVSQIGGKFFGTGSTAQNVGGGADWFNATPADYPGYTVRHVSLPAGTTPQQVAQRIPAAANWMVSMLPKPIQNHVVKVDALAQRMAASSQAAVGAPGSGATPYTIPGSSGGTGQQNNVSVIQGAPLSDSQKVFGAELAKKTGLDPGVIAAWLHSEQPPTGLAPNGPHNWLNIGATDSGFHGAGNPAWQSPKAAADFTAQWLAGKSAPGFGKAVAGIQAVLRTRGQSPAAQIAALQHSGWASSGYPALAQVYNSLAGAVSIGTGNVNIPAGSAPAGSGGGAVSAVPGAATGGAAGTPEGLAAAIGLPADALSRLTPDQLKQVQGFVDAQTQARQNIVQGLLSGSSAPSVFGGGGGRKSVWDVSPPKMPKVPSRRTAYV